MVIVTAYVLFAKRTGCTTYERSTAKAPAGARGLNYGVHALRRAEALAERS